MVFNFTLTALVEPPLEQALRVFYFMKVYLIKSPNGKNHNILADSIYHAVSIAVQRDGYCYSNIDYLKLIYG